MEQLRARRGPVLELGCGPGRLLAAFATLGVDASGVDSSREMVALARRREPSADVVLADMASFDLERAFAGAVCTINSLAHLVDRVDVERHLGCVARHLRRRRRYLVQLDLRDPADPWAGVRPSVWEARTEHVHVRTTWAVEEIDLARGVELHRSRLDVLAGRDAGRVVEEVHRLAAWTPETWVRAIESSPLTYVAAFDGGLPDRPRVPVGTHGRLLWHELARQ